MLVLKEIKPLGDSVITTGDRYDEVYTDGGLIDPSKSGQFKEYQTVLFASEAAVARGIAKDDVVYVNFYNYARPVQKKNNSVRNDMEEHYNQELAFHIPVLEVDKKECLDLRINDVKFVILEMVDDSRGTKVTLETLDNGLVDVTGKTIKRKK
jgi:hypothetical protein